MKIIIDTDSPFDEQVVEQFLELFDKMVNKSSRSVTRARKKPTESDSDRS